MLVSAVPWNPLSPKFHPQMGETPPGFHLLSSNAVNQEFGCNPRLGKSPYDQALLPGRFRRHFFRSNDNTRDQFFELVFNACSFSNR